MNFDSPSQVLNVEHFNSSGLGGVGGQEGYKRIKSTDQIHNCNTGLRTFDHGNFCVGIEILTF